MTAPAELTRAEVRDRIYAAAAERERGMAYAELADDERGGWCTDLIDQAIDWFAQTGEPFSANDFRDLLPEIPSSGLMGARFAAACTLGRIVPSKAPPPASTKRNTHCKRLGSWVGAEFAIVVDDDEAAG